MKYLPQQDDEWVIMQDPSKYKIACCDCGLVHVFEFAVTDDDRLMFRAARDNRATAQRRRNKKEPSEKS